MVFLIFILFIVRADQGFCDNLKKNQKGPTFRTEPPSRVEFSNTAGVELRCGADGIPTPRVYWQSRDGTQVADFPGLRYQRSHKDGASTLVFPPFSRGEYRREVHDAVYQCAANNDVGAVLSRTVHVKAVVKQRFTPQVYDEFVARGNTAVLRCHLPSFAREHVVVDAWLRSDGQVLRIMEEQGRVAGRLSYTVLRSGELLIQDVQKEERDSGRNYRCQTRHKLTGEMVTSESAGKIIVTEPHASTLPSFTFSRSQIRVEENSVAELPCVAQGNPPPTYRWVKDVSGVLIPVKEEKGKIRTNKGMLSILRVQQSDAGQYQCIARNSIGERRTETSLVVTAPLTAVLRPSRLELNVGQEATFNCNVTGHPLRRVAWIRDRLNITPVDNRVRLLSKDVLHISAVRREDKGMYQCFVYSDEDTAQGTAELAISDAPPSMISVFADQDVEPGDRVTMKCIASGNPLPVITWFVYDDPISRTSPRISSNDYVAEPEGHVVSHLNITEARTQDGGEYICKASNEVGYAFHRARLNVRGPAFLRLMRNTTAIGGRDLELRCPYGGNPIREIRWYKDEILLPIDMRQKINSTGVLAIKNIQREADEGQYKCEVQHADGETISGSTYVTVFVSPVIESVHLRNEITVNKNARTKLMCIVNEGDPPLRFHWLKNGHPFLAHGDTTVQTFEDSSIVTFKKVSSSDRGMYTCVVSNVASSTNMTTQLIVNVPPQWTVEPQNTTAILAGKVWIDCAAVGFPAPNILWKKFVRSEKAGDDFAWVHSSPRAHRFQNGTLTLTDIEEEDAGSYLCQAHNGIGAGLSKIISLQVLVPPRFKDTFQSKVVAEGNDTVLKCIAYGDPPIDISWQKDEIELDVKRLTRYSIQKSSKQHETASELIIKSASRDEDTGTFTCTAASNIGEDEAQRHLLVQGIPDPPANVTVVEVTSRSVSLRWEVPHDGNSHRTGSVVQYKTDPDGLWTGSQVSQLIVSGSDTSATLRALSPVTAYLVRIVAENALGKSPPSDITNVTTSEEAPSGAPRDVQVQSTGAQSMKVSWKPPPEDTRNGRIRGYYVGYRQTGTSEPYHFQKVETVPDEDQRQSTYITGLKAFTEYDIAVRAFTSAGTGPKSSRVMGKTLETAPPTSPILQIGASSSSTIDVSWEKDNRDRSAITEYTMHYKADGEEEWRKQKLGGNVDTYTLRGLKCGTRYNLYVTASNSLGTGEPSEPVTGRTKGAAPMSPKMEAFLTPNSTSTILHLDAWRSMGCSVDSFSIQFRPKLRPDSWSSVKTETADSSKTVHVLGPLSPGREYVVLITAHSEAGATQGEYHFKTLSLQASSGHSSNPAYGVPEDKPFYRNVALVIPVVVSSLVLVIVVFAVAVCLRKQSQDRREWLNEYGNHRKGGNDSLMMNEIGNSKKGNYPLPSEKSSHYAIPAASTKKTDYAEPYACDIASRQGSDGLFATIKRGPTRPLHVTAQHKPDGST